MVKITVKKTHTVKARKPIFLKEKPEMGKKMYKISKLAIRSNNKEFFERNTELIKRLAKL
ncbi:MAG: hypothetical protein ACOCXG_00400 [Nanoarchaeota archaeon]